MNKTAIIIPSRLDAIRLPNKPLKLINNKEMILHVYEAATKANAGEVYVATPDKKIICYTQTQKNKLNIVFPFKTEKINLHIRYEKIKGNEIHIELRNDLQSWKIITDRLNN